MKIRAVLVASLFSFTLLGMAADEGFDLSSVGIDSAEIISINKSVTDEELVQIIEDYFTFLPEDLATLKAQSKERTQMLDNFRKFSDEVGVNLVYLRDETTGFKESYSEFAHNVSLGKKRAESVLINITEDGLRQMVFGAKFLIKNKEQYEKRRYSENWHMTEEFPWQFEFVDPDLAYIHEISIQLFIHKGVGAAIGYNIKQVADNKWHVSSFNLYESPYNSENVVIYTKH